LPSSHRGLTMGYDLTNRKCGSATQASIRAKTETALQRDWCGMYEPDRVHPSVHSVFKLAIDLSVAALGSILLAPVLAAVALAIYLVMGGPILFRQVRPGYRARPFTIYKFRTMREARGANGEPLPDAERLTGLGRFLRNASLDEVPQLWNVIRGEMSLVGPRPQLMQDLLLYTREQARRHDVRPGITGWAQVNGRNAIGWVEKLDYDIWYVDHWSLWLDLRILGLTIVKVARCDGIDELGVEARAPSRHSNGDEA
jgi:sugar transferase EpsL